MELENIIHRCFRCGYCKFPSNYTDISCPSYFSSRFETYSPGGRMWLIRAWLDRKLESSERFQEIMYSCATCYNCVLNCAMVDFRDLLLDVFREAKKKLIDEGKVPPPVRDYLENLYKYKNGFGISNKKRFKWAQEVVDFDVNKHEYLLYVGDEGCFDHVANKMAVSTIELLKKMNISFGILRQREISDGIEAYNLGEIELFKEIAGELLGYIKNSRAKKIITISPHTLYAFRELYPQFFDVDFKAYHYTHIINENLSFFTSFLRVHNIPTISYHDPCYLARYLKDFNTVREIFSSLGIRLQEPVRNRMNTLCCGGGSGNFYTGLIQKGHDHTAKERIREMHSMGVDVVITACPICLSMLTDAKKSLGRDIKLEITSLSNFLCNFV